MSETNIKEYTPIPTLRKFHESGAQIRGVVGPVGSGKTTAATWDMCYYIPTFLLERYDMKKTRWVVVRNTLGELLDTTQKTIFDWFDWGRYRAKPYNEYILKYNGMEIEILFRGCDIEKHVRQFKSLEITGYWIDESIELKDSIKKMLKTRIGRYPRKSPVRFGIETTNPPDIEHPMYSQFNWISPPPGPVPTKKPLKNHTGFWQPPRENELNLRKGYYNDLLSDYADEQDWAEMYVNGKPGVMRIGKEVYHNFNREYHVAKESIVDYYRNFKELYRGWDNTGNCPACVLSAIKGHNQVRILKEFHTDREGIVDFAGRVIAECNILFHEASYVDYADPAGSNQFSKPGGGFTSNAELMQDEYQIDVIPSEQNPVARVSSVDGQLKVINGLLIDPDCTRLINGFLGGYHYPEIGATGIYRREPLKNKYSHVHDALQYLLVKIFRSVAKQHEEEAQGGRQQYADTDYDLFR